MAEAWARMTRKPAVAMVTAGRGSRMRSPGSQRPALQRPVVLIAGCVAWRAPRSSTSRTCASSRHRADGQEGVGLSRGRADPEFCRPRLPDRRGGRPSGLPGAPCDVLNAAVDPARVKRLRSRVSPGRRIPSRPKRSSTCWRRPARRSSSPGAAPGTPMRGGPEGVRRARRRSVFTGNAGRGPFRYHPCALNPPWRSVPARFFALASAELGPLFGSRLSLFYLFGDIFGRRAVCQADIEAEEIGRNAPWTGHRRRSSAPCWMS